jgi:hypothetical protein
MKFRFVAEDLLNSGDSGSGGSIIEAAVDDFNIAIFDDEDSQLQGDINGDGGLNVLDVVALVNFVLSSNCSDSADINLDGVCNVLDVVSLVNLILQ